MNAEPHQDVNFLAEMERQLQQDIRQRGAQDDQLIDKQDLHIEGQVQDRGYQDQMQDQEGQPRDDGGEEGRSGSDDDTDRDSDDNNYEVCFVVQDVEFFTFKEGFITQSQQFRDIVEDIDDSQQIRILLPLWATAKAFRIVLDYINTGEMFWASGDKDVEGRDVFLMQNVLWLADFFQLHSLQKLCIDKHIIPGLTQENIIVFIKDAFAKLLSSQEQLATINAKPDNEGNAMLEQQVQSEDIWYEFFNRCIQICAENIDFLVKEKDQEMMDLPDTVVDEILDRALKLRQSINSPDYINFLMKYKKLTSIFEYFDREKLKMVTNYQNLVRNHREVNAFEGQMNQSIRYSNEQQKVKPLLTWRLQNLNLRQNFYKDSDPFFHEGIYWKLYIQKLNDKECQIGLKYAQDFNRESQTRDQQVFYDKYSILSMLSWTRLESEPPFGSHFVNEYNLMSPNQNSVNINNMTISATKSNVVLRNVPLSSLILSTDPAGSSTVNSELDASLSIEIYFQVKPILSSIINYITLNFGQLSISPTLQRLTVDDLALILSHRKINVSSEDEVIAGLMTWLQVNINKITDEQILQIVYHVNWPYVSFDKLLLIYKTFPSLRRIQQSKSIFFNQIQKRATKKSNMMTSPPRCSYSSVIVETTFDYKIYIDKISDFIIGTFEKEDKSNDIIQQLSMELKQLQSKYALLQSQQQSIHISARDANEREDSTNQLARRLEQQNYLITKAQNQKDKDGQNDSMVRGLDQQEHADFLNQNLDWQSQNIQASQDNKNGNLQSLYEQKLKELKELEDQLRLSGQIESTPKGYKQKIKIRANNSIFKQATPQSNNAAGARYSNANVSRASIGYAISGRSNSSRYFQPSQSQNQIDQSQLQQRMQGDNHFHAGAQAILNEFNQGRQDDASKFNQQLIQQQIDEAHNQYDQIKDKLLIGGQASDCHEQEVKADNQKVAQPTYKQKQQKQKGSDVAAITINIAKKNVKTGLIKSPANGKVVSLTSRSKRDQQQPDSIQVGEFLQKKKKQQPATQDIVAQDIQIGLTGSNHAPIQQFDINDADLEDGSEEDKVSQHSLSVSANKRIGNSFTNFGQNIRSNTLSNHSPRTSRSQAMQNRKQEELLNIEKLFSKRKQEVQSEYDAELSSGEEQSVEPHQQRQLSQRSARVQYQSQSGSNQNKLSLRKGNSVFGSNKAGNSNNKQLTNLAHQPIPFGK